MSSPAGVPSEWKKLRKPLANDTLLPTLAVSGVIEHIGLDKGLDMVDKAGVGGRND